MGLFKALREDWQNIGQSKNALKAVILQKQFQKKIDSIPQEEIYRLRHSDIHPESYDYHNALSEKTVGRSVEKTDTRLLPMIKKILAESIDYATEELSLQLRTNGKQALLEKTFPFHALVEKNVHSVLEQIKSGTDPLTGGTLTMDYSYGTIRYIALCGPLQDLIFESNSFLEDKDLDELYNSLCVGNINDYQKALIMDLKKYVLAEDFESKMKALEAKVPEDLPNAHLSEKIAKFFYDSDFKEMSEKALIAYLRGYKNLRECVVSESINNFHNEHEDIRGKTMLVLTYQLAKKADSGYEFIRDVKLTKLLADLELSHAIYAHDVYHSR